MSAELVLGPLLRYVSEDEAVFWVEADSPCEVEVLGSTARTFRVHDHHYALVRASALEPGTRYEYEVKLDGETRWPLPDSGFPPSSFRTYPKKTPLEIVFGSCRVTAPHYAPFSLRKDEDENGREVDSLRALALRMRDHDPDHWPDMLLLLGDQVYADEISPVTRAFVEHRRDPANEPGERVVDFEEYTRLYYEAWSEPTIRWLLSVVSTAMIFDDHDVHDDWNTSESWVEEARQHEWWNEHIVAALMSYWVYQHIGNLNPEAQAEDEMLQKVLAADGDVAEMLAEFAYRADRETDGARWSYCRDVGDTRIVMMDSRAGRVLTEGRRSMVDDEEWEWIVEHASGGFDHLLLATSLPYLLAPALHNLEAWNEAVCGGAWGDAMKGPGEKFRRAQDLEHWAAFHDSFVKLTELQREVATGERGEPPASIVTLSGDVHHAYLAEVGFPHGTNAKSAVWQAVVSPFRNPLDSKERSVIKALTTKPAELLTRVLRRSAGVADPPIRWRLTGDGPWFDNQYGVLTVEGRKLEMRLEKAVPAGDHGETRLERVFDRRLA
jgi:PhoD-like phosphatase